MAQQIWPTKQPDGTIYERHVYSGPQGEGYIDIVRREKLDGEFEVKKTHVGPEDRPSDPDFKPVVLDESEKVKLKRLIEGKAEWKKDSGFEVKEEFKGDYLADGKLKPVEPIEEPIEEPIDPKEKKDAKP